MILFTMLPFVINLIDRKTDIIPEPSEACIIYTISQSAVLTYPDSTQKTLSSESIISPWSEKSFAISPSKGGCTAIIRISRLYIASFNRLQPADIIIDSTASAAQDYHELRQALRALAESYFVPAAASKTSLCGALDSVLSIIFTSHSTPSEPDPRILRAVHLRNYIHSHFTRQITLDEIAQELDMNRTYASEYGKRALGTSIMQYQARLRTRLAEQYLSCTDLPVTEITAVSGFPNTIALNKAIKQAHGKTPLNYRKDNVRTAIPGSVLFADNTAYEQDLNRFSSLVRSAANPVIQRLSTKVILDRPASDQGMLPKFSIISLPYIQTVMYSSFTSSMERIKTDMPVKYIMAHGLYAPDKYISANDIGPDPDSRSIQILRQITRMKLKPLLLLPVEDARDVKLYKKFINNCAAHFGLDEISTWLFEFGPSIRLSLAFSSEPEKFHASLQHIIECIRLTRRLIPEARIGGMVTPHNPDPRIVSIFFEKLQEEDIVPDFSCFLFTSAFHNEDAGVDFPDRYHLSTNANLTYQMLLQLKKITEKYFPGVKIPVYAGVNFNIHADSFLNDSRFNATYQLMNILRLRGVIDRLILPLPNDQCNFTFPGVSRLLFGINSFFTDSGIPKPVFFAMNFLARIHGPILCAGPYHIAAGDTSKSVTILMFNHKFPDAAYCASPDPGILPEDIPGLFPQLPPERYEISIPVPSGRYYIAESYTINRDSGSLLDLLLDAGMPSYLTDDLKIRLARNIHAKMGLKRLPAGKGINIEISLDTLDVVLLHIYPEQVI